MATPADYQRSSNYRENRNLASRVHADFLAFKFEAQTTTDSYAAATLTQVDREGAEIDSTDKRYALSDSASTVDKREYINVCLDAKSTTNNADIQIRVRNEGSTDWVQLSETTAQGATLANLYDDVDGHAELQVRIKANVGGSQGDVSGYLHIS